MATKKYKVTGTAQWAKVFDANAELKDWQGNPHEFGKLYKIDVILDKENKAIYKTSGTSGKGKFSDDGEFIATFKRKEKAPFEWAGGKPEVVNADGTPFEGTLIPNGSTVEVDFTVYSTSMSPGTRLEKVKVITLASMPEREDDVAALADYSIPKPENNTKVGTEVPF